MVLDSSRGAKPPPATNPAAASESVSSFMSLPSLSLNFSLRYVMSPSLHRSLTLTRFIFLILISASCLLYAVEWVAADSSPDSPVPSPSQAPAPVNSDSSSASSSISSFLSCALYSFFLVFVSEFGDKTFVATLLFSLSQSSRTSSSSPSSPTPSSSSSSSAPVHPLPTYSAPSLSQASGSVSASGERPSVSVGVGRWLPLLISTNLAAASVAVATSVLSASISDYIQMESHWIRRLSAALCAIFGIQFLTEQITPEALEKEKEKEREEEKEEDEKHSSSFSWRNWPQASLFLRSFLVSVCTELGDRSQLTMMVLSSDRSNHLLAVLMGGVAGHVGCTALAIGVGDLGTRFLTPKLIQRLGAAIFLALAVAYVYQDIDMSVSHFV